VQGPVRQVSRARSPRGVNGSRWSDRHQATSLRVATDGEAAVEPEPVARRSRSYALKRLGWFLPLLCGGAIPGTTSACAGLSEPSCAAEGEKCGFFTGSCCTGLQCSEAKCRDGGSHSTHADPAASGGRPLDVGLTGMP
jgi:hypothetical protein